MHGKANAVKTAECGEETRGCGNVRLVPVDTENFDALIGLSVSEDQRGELAENVYSLAEAYAELSEGRFVRTFGIYDGSEPVGFLMIGFDHQSCCVAEVPDFIRDNYLIWRLMIDRRYQNRGYGRAAVRLALAYIRTFPCGEAEYCWLSYKPDNEVARRLYRSFGFEERPDYCYEGGEMPAVLRLSPGTVSACPDPASGAGPM